MKVLSQDELNKLLAVDEFKISYRNWVIMRVFAWTGLRVSELVGLNVEGIYFQSEPKKLLLVRFDIAKGGKGREVPISEKLRDVLRDYYRRRALDSHTVGIDPALPLFTQHCNTTERLTTRQIQRIVNMVGIEAGINSLHPHTLRHTFATALLRQTNIRTLQVILGHASLTSTQIYTHPNTEDMAQAVNKL